MIKFDNVSFSYEKNNMILKNISFEIRDGQSVGLIGANGAGKSTVMKILPGLLPYEGDVFVSDIRVCKENLMQIRKKLGFVIQNSDNQMFMPTVLEDMIFAPMNYGMSREEAERKADEVLEQLSLTKLKNRYNHKISGGEKRMASIATVLTMDPEILIMDEPSTALDPFNRRTVINTINKFSKTKLIASHDLDMILDVCDRVILLSDGEIVADGKTEVILKDKALLEGNRMELPLCYSER